jgi:hypothetical protein
MCFLKTSAWWLWVHDRVRSVGWHDLPQAVYGRAEAQTFFWVSVKLTLSFTDGRAARNQAQQGCKFTKPGAEMWAFAAAIKRGFAGTVRALHNAAMHDLSAAPGCGNLMQGFLFKPDSSPFRTAC